MSYMYLQTAVLLVTFVNGNEHSTHIWEKAAISVPVATKKTHNYTRWVSTV